MAKVEIDTLTPECYTYCEHIDIATRPEGGLYCSKKWMCKAGADALYQEVLNRYEEEWRLANGKTTGLKEPGIWLKAINILEEYIE